MKDSKDSTEDTFKEVRGSRLCGVFL